MFLGNKKTFKESLNLFDSFIKNNHNLRLSEISSGLGCSRRIAYLYKHVYSELDRKNIKQIDQTEIELHPEIIAAICLNPTELIDELIIQIEDIHKAKNPFDKIDSIIEKNREINPLELLSTSYWLVISNYLIDRNIDAYPFTKNAIYFIQSIGRKGFHNQSSKQKKWVKGLIEADKLDPSTNYFNNDVLKQKGLSKDLKIINNYMKCL